MLLPRPGVTINIDSLVSITAVTDFAQRTIDLARQNVAEGGRPFATVIVKDGEVLAESANKVAQTNDPTAHAEILATRVACTKLGTEHLIGTTIYVLAHPVLAGAQRRRADGDGPSGRLTHADERGP
jgi:MafB19-like deaminase